MYFTISILIIVAIVACAIGIGIGWVCKSSSKKKVKSVINTPPIFKNLMGTYEIEDNEGRGYSSHATFFPLKGVSVKGDLKTGVLSNGVLDFKVVTINEVKVARGTNIAQFEKKWQAFIKELKDAEAEVKIEYTADKELKNLFEQIDNFHRFKAAKQEQEQEIKK